jgi:Flp pilus assembly protein TadG
MSRASSHTGNAFKIGLRSDRGQATVEFAFVFVMLVIMLVAIVEMIFLVHTYNVLADSAKEGVRYAIVHGANNAYQVGPCPGGPRCSKLTGDPAAPGTRAEDPANAYGVVKTYAQYSLHDVTGTNMTVTVTYGPADTPPVTPLNKTPNRVQVVVTYPYHWFFGLGWAAINVNAAAEGRIMN